MEENPSQEVERGQVLFEMVNTEMGILRNTVKPWVHTQYKNINRSVWDVTHRQECYYSPFPPCLESVGLCFVYK